MGTGANSTAVPADESETVADTDAAGTHDVAGAG
jgi:hypothetical protein